MNIKPIVFVVSILATTAVSADEMTDRLFQYRERVSSTINAGLELQKEPADEFSFNLTNVCVNNLLNAKRSAEAYEQLWRMHLLVSETSKAQESLKILNQWSTSISYEARRSGAFCQPMDAISRYPKRRLWIEAANQLVLELPTLVN